MSTDSKAAVTVADDASDREFVKGLGLTSSTMLVMGSMCAVYRDSLMISALEYLIWDRPEIISFGMSRP